MLSERSSLFSIVIDGGGGLGFLTFAAGAHLLTCSTVGSAADFAADFFVGFEAGFAVFVAVLCVAVHLTCSELSAV